MPDFPPRRPPPGPPGPFPPRPAGRRPPPPHRPAGPDVVLPAKPPPKKFGAKPTGGRPTGGKPTGFKPTGFKPTGFKPGKFVPMGARPTGGKPAAPATDWNGVATWYDELVGDAGSEYHREVVLPGTLRLLAAAKGDRVLDVACGQGVLCRALASTGAAATGVDAAPELIRLARDRQGQVPEAWGPVDYHVGDARDLTAVAGLAEGSFAAAACVLAVQNIHPLGGLMAGVGRALRPGGRFVLVLMHPAFRVPKASGWEWDAKANAQFRRVDRYLLPRKVPITTHPGSDPGGYTWTFHKPIGAYVRALRAAGLLVDAMEEWPSHKTSDSGPRAGAENLAREEIPMFLAVRAIKVVGMATGEAE